jgi:hypothetical protein
MLYCLLTGSLTLIRLLLLCSHLQYAHTPHRHKAATPITLCCISGALYNVCSMYVGCHPFYFHKAEAERLEMGPYRILKIA